MKVLPLSLLFLLLPIMPVSAADGPNRLIAGDVYLSVSSFTWKEYDAGARRILREQGPLYGVGGRGVIDLYRRSLLLSLNGEVFGGNVDYKGQTQTHPDPKVSDRPVDTDVVYLGTSISADLGWSAARGGFSVEPFVGVGYRLWLRDLDDSNALDTDDVPFKVTGYTEYWQTAHSRLGARGRYRTPSGISVFAQGGAKYPFYTGNSVDIADGGMTTFHPGGEWSGFAETGASYRHLKLALFYEGFRFSQSPVNDRSFFQPKSSSDIFGLNLGWVFR